MRALAQKFPRPRFIQKVLGRGSQAAVRGAARCASQVLGHGAKADARGATQVLYRAVLVVNHLQNLGAHLVMPH
jgi:hypothetical protein